MSKISLIIKKSSDPINNNKMSQILSKIGKMSTFHADCLLDSLEVPQGFIVVETNYNSLADMINFVNECGLCGYSVKLNSAL